jgi:5-formyltetrahydrofolate cyclo-ligase
MPFVSDSKSAIRKHFLEIRRAIPPEKAGQAAIDAAENFIKFININNAKTIGCYYALNGEMDAMQLPARLLLKENGDKIAFALPKITAQNSPLIFSKWQIGDRLVKNAIYQQVMEPESGSALVFPDIIIVPLVAFDESCNRIGYGGGYYDRTIASLRESKIVPVTVGYAYECQKYEGILPTDAHDMALDFVITERRLYSKL